MALELVYFPRIRELYGGQIIGLHDRHKGVPKDGLPWFPAAGRMGGDPQGWKPWKPWETQDLEGQKGTW